MKGERKMKQYQVTFTVNGKRTQQNVSANSYSDAKKLVQAQYSGSNVVIVNCKDLTTGYFG